MAKKSKPSLSIKIVAILCGVILAIAAAGGIYCLATKQNPAQAVKSVFSSSETQIVGKWQSQKNPGYFAFVFYDDGTYDSYISTVNISGRYEIRKGKLYLINKKTGKDIVYNFSVNEKVLTLEVLEENGKESETKEQTKYDRVDELKQKTINDLIGEISGEEKAAATE